MLLNKIYSAVNERMSASRIWPLWFEIKKSSCNEKANESHMTRLNKIVYWAIQTFFQQQKILKIKRYVLRYNILSQIGSLSLFSSRVCGYLLLYYYVRYVVLKTMYITVYNTHTEYRTIKYQLLYRRVLKITMLLFFQVMFCTVLLLTYTVWDLKNMYSSVHIIHKGYRTIQYKLLY